MPAYLQRILRNLIFTDLFEGFLTLAYPAKCLVCTKVLPPAMSLPACALCLLDFEFVGETVAGDFSFDSSFSFFEYNNTLREIIHDIKFGGKAHKMVGLTSLAIKMAEERLPFKENFQGQGYEAIVPVPLHAKRYRERGFNQALVIAEVLSKSTGVPIDEGLCERIVDNPPQSMASREARRKNSVDIFSLNDTLHVTGKSFLLVDDIFTSGETLNSLASTFKGAGAKSVSCITIGIRHLKTD